MARKNRTIKSVTLLELIIAIALLSIIVLGLTSIDLFSRHQVVDADRRAKLQNQLYFILEHMNRTIIGTPVTGGAIGNEYLYTDTAPFPSVVNVDEGSGGNDRKRVKIYIDAGRAGGGLPNGTRELPYNNPDVDQDHWVAYFFYDSSSPMAKRQTIRYCGRCNNRQCGNCMDSEAVLADTIVDFIPVKPVDASNNLNANYINIDITACFDPWFADVSRRITASPCGTGDNPQVTMNTSIKMPSVTTR